MRTIKLIIENLPPCPRNRSHFISISGRFPFLAKTEMAKQYVKAIQFHLTKYSSEAREFKESFNPKKQHLIAIWRMWSPEIRTQTGSYSLTGVDLDAHKVLQDTIFDFIGINDALIVSDSRIKIQGGHRLELSLIVANNLPLGEEDTRDALCWF